MSWNTTVCFGMGTAKGENVSGFHQLNHKGVFTGILYRGDDRSPTKLIGSGLFKTGFQLHKSGVNVSGRQTSSVAQVNEESGTTRGVVSATLDLKMAAYWAVHNELQEGWVYCIYIENEEWAAEAEMNLMASSGLPSARTQREIMLLSIPGNRIYAARKVKRVGASYARQTKLIGDLVANKNYTGTNPYGLAFRDPDFKLFVQAGTDILCE